MMMATKTPEQHHENGIFNVVFVPGPGASPYGATSPAPRPAWADVAAQLATRLTHFDERIRARVCADVVASTLDDVCDVVVALGVEETAGLAAVVEKSNPAAVLVDETSSPAAKRFEKFGAWRADRSDDLVQSLVQTLVPWGAVARGARLAGQSATLLARHSSEDACYAILFALNGLVAPIDVVASDINPSWEKGLRRNAQEFAAMARCCGSEVAAALTDPQTKRAIDLLNAVDLRDQVGSYRVIVSNETPELEAFSLCILQQNNVFNCDAPILERPRVPCLATWRGRPFDQAASAAVFIGHLDDVPGGMLSDDDVAATNKLPWSWRIVCGANPAYDAFPCQHQIFYPAGLDDAVASAKASSSSSAALWYDPVFLVETLDGRRVWTKRHYRCTPRGGIPGQWTLTTLDNGVVSKEHWTIVDAADDLSWAVFHYSGAARAAGQSYQGALLCSRDGDWPAACRTPGTPEYERVAGAFEKCGLKLWELYGHGPPSGDSLDDEASFMWTPDFRAFCEAHPPPLDRIGDITITKWRERERAKATTTTTTLAA